MFKLKTLITILVIVGTVDFVNSQDLKSKKDVQKKIENEKTDARAKAFLKQKNPPGSLTDPKQIAAYADSVNKDLTDQLAVLDLKAGLLERQIDLDDLLDNNKEGLIITPNNFTKIVQSKFRTVSGNEIKNGKYFGSSASVDSKSITVNISMKPFKSHEFYLLPSLAGSAKDGFVNVITGNKYSRTVTGGVNFVVPFPKTSFSFNNKIRVKLHNDLKMERYKYLARYSGPNTLSYTLMINNLKAILTQSGAFITNYYSNAAVNSDFVNELKIRDLNMYKKLTDSLLKANILPKSFPELSSIQQLEILKNPSPNKIENAALQNYLSKTDSIQQSVNFSKETLKWLAGGIKYNQANYFIADPATKALQSSVRDEYITANFSATWLVIKESGNRFYISPTINFKNAHNFNPDKQIKADVFEDYNIGNTTVQRVKKELAFYESVPDRLQNFYIEVPMAFYNKKAAIGAEVAFKAGFHDVENDNLGFRVGALIPINQGDKNQMVIEPLFKVQKLNQAVTDFWKDNFVVGINISVTIPKSFFN